MELEDTAMLSSFYVLRKLSTSVLGVGLRPLACWDCGFESHRRHGCLSVVSVVCSTGRGLCERSHHSSRGILQTMMCLSVISKLQKWSGLGPLAL